MKIAVISSSEIPSKRANSIQTMKMCQAFAQLGHTVHLYVPKNEEEVSWEKLKKHYGIETKFKIIWVSNIQFLKKYDFAFKASLMAKKWGAELVFSRLLQVGFFADIAKSPTIVELHDMPTGNNGPKLLQKFFLRKNAKGLISITNVLLKDLLARFPNTKPKMFFKVLPDGVDTERYEKMPSPAEARKVLKLLEKFTVGYTGHLYPGRGGNFILRIAQNCPTVNFLLVGGEVKDIERLEKQAKELNLSNVLLVGFVPNNQLPNYQAAAEILLMPYQKEVAGSSGGNIAKYLSPMKLFEYLATGRVIISSDLPVLQEVLNSKNSIIVDGDDSDAWATAIIDLINDYEKRIRIGQQAKQDSEKYTWKERAKKILSMLN